jgi:transcriptional regulator with XRE-family HTH domain
MELDERIARGQRIEQAIKDAGMLPVEVAKRMKKSPSTLTQWISGETKELSARNLLTFCEITRTTPEWIEYGRGSRSARSMFAEEEVLIDDYRCLPEGWKFYLRHKAGELAAIARTLPPFIFESFRPLPPDATYWQWEQDLNDYVRQQRRERNHDQQA